MRCSGASHATVDLYLPTAAAISATVPLPLIPSIPGAAGQSHGCLASIGLEHAALFPTSRRVRLRACRRDTQALWRTSEAASQPRLPLSPSHCARTLDQILQRTRRQKRNAVPCSQITRRGCGIRWWRFFASFIDSGHFGADSDSPSSLVPKIPSSAAPKEAA